MKRSILVSLILAFAACSSADILAQTAMRTRQPEMYVVSSSPLRFEKVLRLPPNLSILRTSTFGTRSVSIDGGRTWANLTKTIQLEAPPIIWDRVISPDSMIACAPLEVRERFDQKTLAVTTSANYQNRFFLLDANSGGERWRVNLPRKDSTFAFRDSYDEGESTIAFNGFVLNDPIITVSGYKCDLRVDQLSGNATPINYSLAPDHSAKPGPWIRDGDQYIVAGSVYHGTQISRLDQSGSVSDRMITGCGPLRDVVGNSIIKLSDGGLLVTGSGWDADLNSCSWLFKMDRSGDSIWSYYGKHEEADTNWVSSMHSVELEDGSILSLGATRTWSAKYPVYAQILEFSSEGQLQRIKPIVSNANTEGFDIVKLPNGLLAVCGYTDFNTGIDFAGSEDFYLLVLNRNLDVISEYRWGVEGKTDLLTKMTLASNGDLIVGGLTNGGSNMEGAKNYFARIRLPQSGVSTTAQSTSGLSLYPNPASSNATLQFASELQNVHVELLDIKGSLIRTLASTRSVSRNIELDLSDVASGYYFVRVSSDSGIEVRPLVRQ